MNTWVMRAVPASKIGSNFRRMHESLNQCKSQGDLDNLFD